ncbi:MAG: carboxylesterase/lipase family protein [Acidimicrobiia bacterium]
MDGHVDEILVGTRAGKLSGRRENGAVVFRGIPYAASTAGSNRFRPPQPVVPWADTRDASRFGPVAPQQPSAMEALLGQSEIDSSEDCLSLNVWTPAADDRRRPVMVWIHGGAFIFGSGSTPWYDGTRFALTGDAVVVTINYRLGAFGFTYLEKIGLDGLCGEEFTGSGNVGILDQIAALEWVRDNIETFGGNPDDVTIFGESAGAMSVGTLLGAPSADGLFHRAILQSGAASFATEPGDATAVAERLMTTAGVSTVTDLVALPAEELLAAQQRMIAAAGTLGLPFRPVVDGTVLPAVPLDTIASGATGDVPILIGTNLDETTLVLVLDPTLGDLDEAGLIARATAMFGDHAATAVEHYRRNRPDASLRDVLVAITSDAVFRIPAVRLAEAQARHGRPVYSYLFTWATPAFNGALGSTHALEIPFVFDNLDQPGVGFLTGDGAERAALATTMHAGWIRFAQTGDAGWEPYDLDRRVTKIFDGADHPVADDPAGDERAIWEGVTLRT